MYIIHLIYIYIFLLFTEVKILIVKNKKTNQYNRVYLIFLLVHKETD